MRRIFALVLAISALALPAQVPDPARTGEKPQLAFLLLSTWTDRHQRDAERGKSLASGILYGSGVAAGTSAGLIGMRGDLLSSYVLGAPMDSDLRQNLAIGLGLGGAALVIAGFAVTLIPIPDYREDYADVFNEGDPDTREALAVSTLSFNADKGKDRRIATFISSFLVPVVMGGLRVGFNLSESKAWSDGLLNSLGSTSWSIAAGLTSLFSKSPEEQLYDRYLSARDALAAK